MGFLKRLLLGRDEEPTTSVLTRQELLDRIYGHFMVRMEQETTTEGLLFPTNFCVYMNEGDYDAAEDTFAYTAKEVAAKMEREVVRRQQKYPSYRPHARFWQFQFVRFGADNAMPDVDGLATTLEPKQLFVASTIHAEQSVQEQPMQEHVVGTMHVKDSLSVSRLAINMNALPGVDMRAKDCIRIDFMSSVNHGAAPTNAWGGAGAPVVRQNGGDGCVAKLRVSQSAFLVNDSRSQVFYMQGTNLLISGRSDSEGRGGLQIARLDTDRVLNPHVEIEYQAWQKEFRLRATGDVVLNEVVLARGAWVVLPNRSAIVLGGEIQIDFERT